jgi:hypothetical protein
MPATETNRAQLTERLLAAVLVAIALWHAALVGGSMASSSLVTDEFGTILSYSARGPRQVMTDYSAPKNHIFFNLLNSILPGRESLHPGRARIVSFAAAFALAAVILVWSWRRSSVAEGAIVIGLWGLSSHLLGLTYEARGYGLLALFAVLSTIATIEYLDQRRLRWLLLLAACTVLGAYTIPTYLFFGGPLMVLLWLAEPRRPSFIAGVLAGIAIVALYLPVIGDVIRYLADSGELAEVDFAYVQAVFRTIKLYLLPSPDWATFCVFIGLVLAPFLGDGNRRTIGLRVTTGAILVFFAICLWIRTTPTRVTSFTVLPLALTGVLAIGWLLRGRFPALVQLAAFGLAAAWLAVGGVSQIASFRFTPPEDWTTAAQILDAAFPTRIPIDVQKAKYLKHFLDRDRTLTSSGIDPNTFAGSTQVLALAPNKWAANQPSHPAREAKRGIELIIPGSIRDVVAGFVLPPSPTLRSSVSELIDADPATGVPIDGRPFPFELPTDSKAHALVLLMERPVPIERASAFEIVDGARIDRTRDLVIGGNAIVLPLGPTKPGARIEFSLDAGGESNRLVESWALPIE